MADKDIHRKIATVKRQIAGVQQSRDEWAKLIPDAEKGSDDLLAEITTVIEGDDEKLAALYEELAVLEEQLPKKPEPAAPKFDPEKHPLLRKSVDKVEPAKPVNFNAGDIVEAQWTDRQWYKAKVQTVLGSASDPKYHVRFVEYDDTTTVGRDAVRPLPSENKKRKAEALNAPATPPVPNSPHVISGPASINPEALAAKKELTPDPNAPQARRKIGGHKALERKANDWKAFTSKGVGKQIAKKDSMFRSGTAVNSRVGFTGSGAGMTQTSKRLRYNNKDQDDEDDEGAPQGNNTGRDHTHKLVELKRPRRTEMSAH